MNVLNICKGSELQSDMPSLSLCRCNPMTLKMLQMWFARNHEPTGNPSVHLSVDPTLTDDIKRSAWLGT